MKCKNVKYKTKYSNYYSKIPNEKLVHKEVKISTLHEIEDESGNKEVYELDLPEESLGTQSLFFFSTILKEAFEKGKVIIVDEIDKSLHPLLVEFLIKFLFCQQVVLLTYNFIL